MVERSIYSKVSITHKSRNTKVNHRALAVYLQGPLREASVIVNQRNKEKTKVETEHAVTY